MNVNSSRVHTSFKEERIWISTWNIIEDHLSELHKITIVKSLSIWPRNGAPQIGHPNPYPKPVPPNLPLNRLHRPVPDWSQKGRIRNFSLDSVASFYFELFDNIYWKFIWCSRTLPLSLLLFKIRSSNDSKSWKLKIDL